VTLLTPGGDETTLPPAAGNLGAYAATTNSGTRRRICAWQHISCSLRDSRRWSDVPCAAPVCMWRRLCHPQGKSINQVAESITTTDSQTFTIKVKPGWKFTNGEPVDAKSFVDAWNFGALITNAQLNAYFFEPIDGYTEVHPAADGAKPTATATTMKGLAVVDDSTFTARLTSAQAS